MKHLLSLIAFVSLSLLPRFGHAQPVVNLVAHSSNDIIHVIGVEDGRQAVYQLNTATYTFESVVELPTVDGSLIFVDVESKILVESTEAVSYTHLTLPTKRIV